MPRQKIGWGTTPWSSSSEKAKILKSRLQSGEIDSYHWTAALLVELFPELELNKHPISSVRTFVKRNAQEINQKRGVAVQKALKDKKRNTPEPPSSPESSLPSSPDSSPHSSSGPSPIAMSSGKKDKGVSFDGGLPPRSPDQLSARMSRLGVNTGAEAIFVDNESTKIVEVKGEMVECSVLQLPVRMNPSVKRQNKDGKYVNTTMIFADALGGMFPNYDIVHTKILHTGWHVELVLKTPGNLKDPTHIINAMTYDKKQEMTSTTGQKFETKTSHRFFPDTSAEAIGMMAVCEEKKDDLYVMHIKLPYKCDLAFYDYLYRGRKLIEGGMLPGEGNLNIHHEAYAAAADVDAKKAALESVGMYKLLWFFVVEEGGSEPPDSLRYYGTTAPSPKAASGTQPMDAASFEAEQFGGGKRKKT